jgi:chemotaxis protein methyltransferase CheR
MRDSDCVEFLQWCLPQLNLRWAGFRKVRGTVCKRISRRLRELELEDLEAYRLRLAEDPKEWARLDSFCRIPISRFYRDRGLFDRLRNELLPVLAAAAKDRGVQGIRCWSAGCASGEEVYSLKIAWEEGGIAQFPEIGLSILGTDADETMIRRAKAGCYGRGSLKDLPKDLWDRCFIAQDDLLCVRPDFRDGIELKLQDIRNAWPDRIFDLILCRNLVFTYFTPALQLRVLGELSRRLRAGGYLILGSHEKLPAGTVGYEAHEEDGPIYRKLSPL